MLLPRIIPVLLIQNNGLVKTVKFQDSKYVGDPINVVKIFNEKEVDELFLIDIDKTIKNEEPNYELLKKISSECRMPVAYGGGVKTVDQIEKIIGLGIEKVSISSGFFTDETLSKIGAKKVGAQSIILTLDLKLRKDNNYEVYTKNGKEKIPFNIFHSIEGLSELGIGELVLNFIDKDGMMDGYDIDFIKKISMKCKTPLSVIGGAGSLKDIRKLFHEVGIVGAGAGSLFIFKGKYKAVLINYPTPEEKLEIYKL